MSETTKEALEAAQNIDILIDQINRADAQGELPDCVQGELLFKCEKGLEAIRAALEGEKWTKERPPTGQSAIVKIPCSVAATWDPEKTGLQTKGGDYFWITKPEGVEWLHPPTQEGAGG